MRIAHVVARRVDVPRSGYEMRAWTVSTSLALLGELHVVKVGPDTTDDPVLDAIRLGADRVAAYQRVTTGDLGRWLTRNRFDVVVAAETALAPWVREAGGATRVVNCQNVESELWHEHAVRAAPDQRAAHTLRARSFALLERSVLPQVDQVWVVNQLDAVALTSRVPGLDVRVVPNVVPVAAEPARRRPEPGYGVFVGSLWYGPNQEAVVELLGVSDELSRRGRPHRFSVVGGGAPDWLSGEMARRPAVCAEGFVVDLADVLGRAACVVLPATYGGGSMVKLIEALAAGCTVVTTPIGARGISDLVDGDHAIVRPLGPTFVDAVEAVLAAPAQYAHVGRLGAQLVRDRYSIGMLDSLLSELIG